jgi:hypothetical protein|tara:strand:+ start:1306 stop:2862 length:1557 start_codon:yes stop_codon:yes gene_type:complete
MGLSRKLADLGKFIDSAATSDFLTVDDSGGKFRDVLWTEIAGKPTTLDSAAAQAIVDSAYVQARQVDVGLDSALVTSLVDSSYVQARQGDVGLDSAGITGIVDSAYVNARITSGLDSAGTISLVDSTYVDARTTANSGFKNYRYTATAGQTAFTNSDENGSVLSYSGDALLVFYNGVVLEPTVDYSTSGSNTVTLTEGADSGVSVNVATWTIQSSGGSTSFWGGDRGLLGGGDTGGSPGTNVIDYWDITSSGNATDFGDLVSSKHSMSDGTGNTTRGVFCGGYVGSTFTTVDEIDYVTVSTTGNAQDFGNLTTGSYVGATAGNGTYGVTAIGYDNGATVVNTLDYFTIATTGNASDFGDLTTARYATAGAENGTYSLYMGGQSPITNVVDYITVASPGNATDFGDLTQSLRGGAACADATRAVVGGGFDSSPGRTNVMEYFTVDTPSNGTDFGDLTNSINSSHACSNTTYGTWAGGSDNSGSVNVIQIVTIQTAGNATDHGDLTSSRNGGAACSGAAS